MKKRRHLLKSMLATAGVANSLPLLGGGRIMTKDSGKKGLRRVIFFLQNHGFDPHTCIPEGIRESCKLDSFHLEEPMKALEPYKDKMNIIMGLHGTHTSPAHSAGFGALGGYRGGMGMPPSAITIDTALSKQLPKTVMPHLCIGMDSLDGMKAKPTIATLSAHGSDQPIPMYSDPNLLYQQIFGSIAEGKVHLQDKVRTTILKDLEVISKGFYKNLPDHEKNIFRKYSGGLNEINGLRARLKEIPEVLKRNVPKYTDKYLNPKFETDWHDALLDLSIASLKANLSNVVTIGSGRGEIFGSWNGLGLSVYGHKLGHMSQSGNEIWIKIRDYNSQMLVKIIKALEETPEITGRGSMMDNTIIVYTSNNADKQHTTGSTWPFVLIGDGGGKIRTGRFTQLKKQRPINDLYTTLLNVAGHKIDRFNMTPALAQNTSSQLGPIEEILV